MLISKVYKFIIENKLIEKNDKVMLAISGGPDSIAMFHILYRLKDKLNVKYEIFHLNHMLRDEDASKDEKFVNDLANRYGIKINSIKVNVEKYAKENKMSLETAGRYLRYEKMQKLVKESSDIKKIATAHNLDDNSESVIMHLIRGSGLKGITGISPVRDNIIRPILCLSKEEILKFLDENNLKYRVDHTNFLDDYKRNFIRLNIIPEIEKEFLVDLKNNIFRFSKLMDNDYNYLIYNAKKEYNRIKKANDNNEENCVKLKIDMLKKLHLAMLNRVIFLAIEEILDSRIDISYTHIEYIKSMLDKQSGAIIDLPNDLVAFKEFNYVGIRKKDKGKNSKTQVLVKLNEKIHVGNYELYFSVKETDEVKNKLTKDTKKMYLCYDKIYECDTLKIRNRKKGDRIYLSQRKITKKLKDYLIEEKIAKSKRDQLLFLTLNGKIIWLIGEKEPFNLKADKSTNKLLIVEYNKL